MAKYGDAEVCSDCRNAERMWEGKAGVRVRRREPEVEETEDWEPIFEAMQKLMEKGRPQKKKRSRKV
jgi:NMD protein affecting ribosome stability and mRNA decay